MSTVGRRLLSAVIQSADIKEYVNLGLHKELLRDSEIVLFEYIQGFISKYGKVPSASTIVEFVGDVLVKVEEPPKFYMEQVQERYLQDTLKMMVLDVQEKLKDKNPKSAMETVMSLVSTIHRTQNKKALLDVRDLAEFIGKVYVETKSAYIQGGSPGIMYGFPTLDGLTSGQQPGDMTSIVGRPAQGKSFLLLSLAIHAWLSGHTVLFVSMEMNMKIMAQRLAAMNTKLPLTKLMKGMLTTKAWNPAMAEMKAFKQMANGFYIVDGNLASTTTDIALYCHYLNPAYVVVDGGYLVQVPNGERMNKFEKIGVVAREFKQNIATELKIPVAVSYQMNRKKTKKTKDGEESGLDDIYGSDEIAQLSSVVLGLKQPESVETLKKRTVDILKGRSGETGKFSINWDFESMDFSEDNEDDTEGLQFIGG